MSLGSKAVPAPSGPLAAVSANSCAAALPSKSTSSDGSSGCSVPPLSVMVVNTGNCSPLTQPIPAGLPASGAGPPPCSPCPSKNASSPPGTLGAVASFVAPSGSATACISITVCPLGAPWPAASQGGALGPALSWSSACMCEVASRSTPMTACIGTWSPLIGEASPLPLSSQGVPMSLVPGTEMPPLGGIAAVAFATPGDASQPTEETVRVDGSASGKPSTWVETGKAEAAAEAMAGVVVAEAPMKPCNCVGDESVFPAKVKVVRSEAGTESEPSPLTLEPFALPPLKARAWSPALELAGR
eukprot:scaffold112618_cov30-Tisochrysis_lutea.AAC.4